MLVKKNITSPNKREVKPEKKKVFNAARLFNKLTLAFASQDVSVLEKRPKNTI